MSDTRLLVTDLDNTLYDWVTFFAHSFNDMVDALQEMTGIDRQQLVSEFKTVHRRYGNSEQPFAVLELPSVQRHFGTTSPEQLHRHVDPALHAFNRSRKAHLSLYDTVRDTLNRLTQRGVVVVGHTEATTVNSYWRLTKLDIAQYFTRLYALEHFGDRPLAAARMTSLEAPPDVIRILPRAERKPNPALLSDICRREGFRASQAVYVGDSLTRDVSMAKAAGVTAVWAKYGTVFDRSLWDLLVSVTHWTEDDVRREGELKKNFANVQPDFVINAFSDLEKILSQDVQFHQSAAV